MSDHTPAQGTMLTPAALFQLRGELDVLRARIEGDRQKVASLERRVEELVFGINQRIDGIDTRLAVTETIQDRLLSEVTITKLCGTRTEIYMLSMLRQLKLEAPAIPAELREPELRAPA